MKNMTKLAIIIFAICFIYPTAASTEVSTSILTSYIEELKTSLIDYLADVNYVINGAHVAINESERFFKTFLSTGVSIEKETSAAINNTMRVFGKDANDLFTATSEIDIGKCMVLTSSIEEKATEILTKTNTCVQDKFSEAQVYLEKSISFIEYILTRLHALKSATEANYSQMTRSTNIITLIQTQMFLRWVYLQPSQLADEIISIITDETIVISGIDDLMITQCDPTEALGYLINDMQLVYSEIENCIAVMKTSDADNLPSLDENSIEI